jgi:hypothetical protein
MNGTNIIIFCINIFYGFIFCEKNLGAIETKSMKEIRAHLNHEPAHSPIASEGKESPEVESFEERVAQFEVENLVQQWYGETSFSSFRFGYGQEARPSCSHTTI